MNELYTCDGCDRKNLVFGETCSVNKAGSCLCYDCLNQMWPEYRALWDDAFSIQERVAEVLHG